MSLQLKVEKILKKEFAKRKSRNPSYSMRAFSRFLGVDQSTLSRFLNRERNLSMSMIENCLKKLELPSHILHDLKQTKRTRDRSYEALEENVLLMLSDWRYWAILEYFKINAASDANEIAKHFNLGLALTRRAIGLLEKLGFIGKEDQTYVLLRPDNSWIDSSKSSRARKDLQRKYIQMSLRALDTYPIKHRFHGSLTVAVDHSMLPEIKEKIGEFQKELGDFCQKRRLLKKVYQMQISFFPLSKVEDL